MASLSRSGTIAGVAGGVIKILSIVVGGPLTVFGLMAVIGSFTDNGWIRVFGAVVVAIGVPALLADRVLPDDPREGDGVVTDVFALLWLAFPVIYIGLLAPMTRTSLSREAERHAAADRQLIARVERWLTGTRAADATPTAQDKPEPTAADAEADKAARVQGEKAAKAELAPPVDGGPAVAEAPIPPGDAGAAAGADAGPPPAGAASADLPPEEIFSRWAPSVVTIQIGEGGGTGFVVDRKGTIVTNHHVIDNASAVRVKYMDGTWADKVELLADDAENDLALLRVSPSKSLVPVTLGDSDKIKIGERAISIGNPLGLEHTLTDGIVSARRVIQGRKMIQMSTPISPGNSGGPLFNLRGEVIGVSTATLSGFGQGQNLNLAVPVATLRAMIKDSYPKPKRIGGGGGPDIGTW